MKNPLKQPTAWSTRCGQVERRKRPNQRSGQATVRKDANEQAPKSPSPHEPTDKGDQYLNIGAFTASRQPAALKGKPSVKAALTTSDLNIMCQKRPGRSRSMTRKRPHSTTSGKAIQ